MNLYRCVNICAIWAHRKNKMKKIIIISCISFMTLSFCLFKRQGKNTDCTLAYVEEVYIDRGSEIDDDKGETVYTKGEGKTIDKFIGVFPKDNDTVTIYKLNNEITEKPEKFSFWSKRSTKDNSIIFYCSQGNNVKVVFTNDKIIVANDIYTVNNQYFKFLKQKLIREGSILDLAFLLKDGYGDYAEFLDPLNKNWRNQKENSSYKIIAVKIKNRNYQNDNHFFEYKATYKYKKEGRLERISGGSRYNKVCEEENNIYIKYSIQDGKNERSSSSEELYKNKKTLFDSILGSWTQNSTIRTSYYTKYQSNLQIKESATKPKNLNELIMVFNIKKD